MRNNSKLSIVSRFGNHAASLMSPLHIDAVRALAATREAQETIEVVEANCAQNMGIVADTRKPFMFSDGMAIIPVYGVLLHRDGYCDSYATGYDYIRNRFEMAMADPEVKGILFDVNSPGGQVSGNFELCDMIYEGRSKKPSLALVDCMAYSGGYSIGSSCTRMVATPSAGVGSIGVVMMHVSIEKALENFGVQVNFIYAGKHKIDGTMFKDMSDETKERFQKSVDKSYQKFTSLVARNRGMELDAVKGTEALCYDADEGLSIGLIDGISTSHEALVAFRNELNGSVNSPAKGVKKMSKETEQTAGDSAAIATATTQAKTDERQRVAAITTCEEAKGREKLANHLAFKTEMSVEDAKAMLSESEQAKPEVKPATDGKEAAKPNHFEKAMENGNPNVGAGGNGEGSEGEGKKMSAAERISKAHQNVTGYNRPDKK